MAYTLYTDKPEEFAAKIKLSGASLNQSFCRLVVESTDINLIFKGEIDKNGNCTIPIKRLRNIIPEGTHGTMKLEVIAEDTYFVPWESEFNVETSKSVKVEIKQQKSKSVNVVMETVKPQATATIVTKQKQKPKQTIDLQESTRKLHLKNFTKQIMSEGITLQNIRKHKNRINELSNTLIFEHNITEDTRKWIINNTLKILAKRTKK